MREADKKLIFENSGIETPEIAATIFYDVDGENGAFIGATDHGVKKSKYKEGEELDLVLKSEHKKSLNEVAREAFVYGRANMRERRLQDLRQRKKFLEKKVQDSDSEDSSVENTLERIDEIESLLEDIEND